MSQTNAQKYVARGLEMVRRGRPQKRFIVDPSEWAFIDEPPQPKRHFGKSQSNGGRICRTPYCLEFVCDRNAPCPHCDGRP